MNNNKEIIYFCNCYYLMLDYDQSMHQIVEEFIEKESNEIVNELLKELQYIISTEDNQKREYILQVITKCDDMDIDFFTMEKILIDIYQEFMKQLE